MTGTGDGMRPFSFRAAGRAHPRFSNSRPAAHSPPRNRFTRMRHFESGLARDNHDGPGLRAEGDTCLEPRAGSGALTSQGG